MENEPKSVSRPFLFSDFDFLHMMTFLDFFVLLFYD